MTMNTETLRNADFSDFVTLLKDQHSRKVDVVLPAKSLWFRGGQLVITGADVLVEDEGVTDPNGTYRPTAIFDEGVAEKLKLNLTYLRKLRAEGRIHLLDQNVNELLHGWKDDGIDGHDGRFMVRTFRSDDSQEGVARTLLSPSYKRIENLDALLAVLDGMKRAGLGADHIRKCDLTERRMYVTVVAEEIQAMAPELLKNYRSPFTGNRGADNPTVFAGFVVSNSEVGDGTYSIKPRLTVQVCDNGMTIDAGANTFAKRHLGAKLDDGIHRVSDETREANLALIASEAKDTVETYLTPAFLEDAVRKLEEKAGKPVAAVEAQKTIEFVSSRLTYGKDAAAGILDHFLTAGDLTSGGVMQAVTSFAQTVEDADKARNMEETASRVLDLV